MHKIKRTFVVSASFLSVLLVTAIAAPAQTFDTLYSFDSTDGKYPYAGLVQATDGNLYGTTLYGGSGGWGTAFKITLGGTLTTLHNFCLQSECTDGNLPYAGLVQAGDGNLYGTASGGGANGYGTVFRITSRGTLTILHSFDNTDGANPYAALIQATDGSLYGTTYGGGANSCLYGGMSYGCGTVFKITLSGTFTTLYSFDGTDGQNPFGGLVQATDGNFYGTTQLGGDTNVGAGTVFRITPGGTLTTLHSFCAQYPDCSDGAGPEAGLIQATDGNFYGTTLSGGANGPYYGTVFKITPTGTLTTLYSFGGEDYNPSAALIQATDGNFYGTTINTVFKITPSGTLTTVYNFDGTDGSGADPFAPLIQDTNGNFYGTTSSGGAYGPYGTIFGLTVGLAPFVETRPTSAKVGKPIDILGTSLKSATSVTFNGTAATFTVVSRSLITATVPEGATSGTVQVTTPGGALSSNVPFHVVH